MNIPDDLKYTKTHEWIRLEGSVATIGITDYAQSELGDIVYVELPEAGRILAVGDTFGTVESVKTVSDVYAPVSGEVVETNPELESASELLNQEPYGEGWMVKIRMDGDVPDALTADAYRTLLETE
ncbi:MAG: glycine cleavage system protein GcvH [Armatimonadetes bacterium]|nr:glycine cleavage system protein GcvH [Armatimonadota bacterium]